jgi:outer membrane protein
MKKMILSVLIISVISGGAFSAQNNGSSPQLSLSNAISIALKENPAITAAKKDLEAADGRLGQAFGLVLPNLTVTANIGDRYQDPQEMVFQMGTSETKLETGTDETARSSGHTFTLAQPLFTGGKLSAGLEIAQAGYDIAKESLRKAQYDLTYSVVSSYYGALRAQKLSDLANESLDMANSHLKQVKAMYQAGTATRADVLRVEVQVSNMEVSVKRASNGLAVAKDAFNNVLSRDLEAPVVLSEKELVGEIVAARSYSECAAKVFDTRPDWKIFQLNKKISHKSIGMNYGDYFPSISLVGTSGNQKTDYPTYPADNDTNSWSAMLSGSWVLFDGLATPSRVKEAQAKYDAVVAREVSSKNGILLEVKDACLNVASALDVIKSAKKGVESADENYRISKEKYANGIGSNLEMIDAQTSFKEAKTNLYQAQFDYQIAKAKVNQVMGENIYSFATREDK